MRYFLDMYQGEPPQVRKAGLLKVCGMREYKHRDRRKAMSDLRPAPDTARALKKAGFTHYGLYEVPLGEVIGPLVHVEEI